MKGIHKVKKYLQRFGYLSSTHVHDHDDDDFDDALESAIKSFQSYYHLTPTGILDAPTADEMSKSRCGVPDHLPVGVINNTNSDIHGHLNIGSHYAFLPNNPVWPVDHRHLIYLVDTGSHPEAADAVAKAFDTWAGVTAFTFERTSDPLAANLKISFQVGDHGDGQAFDGPKGILAHAFGPVDGRFHYDGAENWVVGSVADSYDLQTVATHEIGHLLGLAHTPVKEAIMFASFSPGEIKGLAQDDLDGIKALYSGV